MQYQVVDIKEENNSKVVTLCAKEITHLHHIYISLYFIILFCVPKSWLTGLIIKVQLSPVFFLPLFFCGFVFFAKNKNKTEKKKRDSKNDIENSASSKYYSLMSSVIWDDSKQLTLKGWLSFCLLFF